MRRLSALSLLIGAASVTPVWAQEHPPTSPTDSTRGVTIRLTPPGSYSDSVRVAYVGVWTVGHEENRLRPCGRWIPDSLGGVPFDPDRIGMAPPAEEHTFAGRARPDSAFASGFLGSRPEGGPPALFVRGTGWLVGPGAYGHLGTVRYLVRTEDYAEMRWVTPGDCSGA